MQNVINIELSSKTAENLYRFLEQFDIAYDIENENEVYELGSTIGETVNSDYIVCEGFLVEPVIVVDVPNWIGIEERQNYIDEITEGEHHCQFGTNEGICLSVLIRLKAEMIRFDRYILLVDSFEVYQVDCD